MKLTQRLIISTFLLFPIVVWNSLHHILTCCSFFSIHPFELMEFFQKAKVVRLRSYHDKYMLADENQENVFQDRNGCYNNAKWEVEVIENSNFIRLKSCYGKYLTASNMPFILRGTGKNVFQTLPSRLNSSVEWEPIREGVQVRLRTRYGQYLRANGGLPPWRNTITHDVPHRTSTANWILWDVDIVELRPRNQLKPRPRPTPITPPVSRSLNPTPTCLSPSSCPSAIIADTDSLVKIDLRSPITPEVRLIKLTILFFRFKKLKMEQISEF